MVMVRAEGLEPPNLAAAGPKPAVSTNSTTPAAPPPLPAPNGYGKTVPETVPGVPEECLNCARQFSSTPWII